MKRINKVFYVLLLVFTSVWGINNYIQKKYYYEQFLVCDNKLKKFMYYFKILDNWMVVKEEHRVIEAYFRKRGYCRIAVYGLGKLSEHLLKSLEGSSVEVLFALDKAADKKYLKIPVYFPEMVLPDVDAIVVTINEFDMIEKKLKELTKIPVISLEEIVEEVKNQGNYNES